LCWEKKRFMFPEQCGAITALAISSENLLLL